MSIKKLKNYDSLHDLDDCIVALYKQMYVKDKLIELLKNKLSDKE